MAHFAVICPPLEGHLNPSLALGRTLLDRGHRATVLALRDGETKIRAAGLEFAAIGETDFPLGTVPKNTARLGEMSGLTAVRFTVSMLREGAAVVLRDAPAVLDRIGADLVLVDQISGEAGAVCENLQLPFISLCNALLLNEEATVPPMVLPWHYRNTRWGWLRNQLGYLLIKQVRKPVRSLIEQQRAAWGLRKFNRIEEAFSPLATLSQQPPMFEFPRQQLPESFHFLGPFQHPHSRPEVPFPWDQLDGRPLVYASLGTLQNRLQGVFQQIALACRDLPVQLVLSQGGSGQQLSPTWPGQPIVVRYAPQLELIRRAAAVVTHAGLNTTLESLANGVPLVAIPITNDQPGVGARLVWSGAGAVVPLRQVSAPRLRTALDRVLHDPRYRAQAALQQQSIATAGGARRACEIIELALATKAPVGRTAFATHGAA